jgi:alcohol dehydrogenase class IV
VVYPGEVFTGPGSIAALSYLDGDSICLVINNSINKNTYFNEKISKIFKNKKILIVVIPSGEPEISKLEGFSDKINNFMPDWIIGIGGGSIIDSAKILWIKYEHLGINKEDLKKPFFIKELSNKSKFAAIPTTAGTGSEVSSSAVYYESELNKSKKFVISHEILPHVVILDLNLLTELPNLVKISGVLDTITHSIEGYVSPYSNDIVKDYSIMSLQLIKENYEEFININSEKSIQAILRASHYAGYVQNMAIPGFAHALSHAIGRYGITHGLGCGASLPYVIRYNSSDLKCLDGYNEIAKRLNLNGVESIIELIKSILPKSEIQNIKKLITYAINDHVVLKDMLDDPTYRSNPRKIDMVEFLKIVEEYNE